MHWLKIWNPKRKKIILRKKTMLDEIQEIGGLLYFWNFSCSNGIPGNLLLEDIFCCFLTLRWMLLFGQPLIRINIYINPFFYSRGGCHIELIQYFSSKNKI